METNISLVYLYFAMVIFAILQYRSGVISQHIDFRGKYVDCMHFVLKLALFSIG